MTPTRAKTRCRRCGKPYAEHIERTPADVRCEDGPTFQKAMTFGAQFSANTRELRGLDSVLRELMRGGDPRVLGRAKEAKAWRDKVETMKRTLREKGTDGR